MGRYILPQIERKFSGSKSGISEKSDLDPVKEGRDPKTSWFLNTEQLFCATGNFWITNSVTVRNLTGISDCVVFEYYEHL